jgi:hypothetical protein
MSLHEYDYVVVGSGIAGLTFALKVAKQGRVAVLTKKNAVDSNTNWAQGGFSCVKGKDDSFDLHVADTLDAGAGLCREDIVRMIVSAGPDRVADLESWGVIFDSHLENGETVYDLGLEGGHSRNRVLHTKDSTGKEIATKLVAAAKAEPNIFLFENHYAIDLITTAKLGMATEKPGARALRVRGNHREPRSIPFHPGDSGHRWVRARLSIHHQSPRRHRRWRRNGLAGRSHHRQHGIHPIPSDLSVSPKREKFPDHRSHARRRCRSR